jgi:hypothetical protein
VSFSAGEPCAGDQRSIDKVYKAHRTNLNALYEELTRLVDVVSGANDQSAKWKVNKGLSAVHRSMAGAVAQPHVSLAEGRPCTRFQAKSAGAEISYEDAADARTIRRL